jgi:hypothetical protein
MVTDRHAHREVVVKGLLPLLAVVALFSACAPDVPQSPPPGNRIVVSFDLSASPPVVPVPNDLAISPVTGKIVVPSSPTDSPAQTEFNQDYLGTLGGFPYESTASVSVSGALNPGTVSATSVIGVDLTVAKTNPSASAVIFGKLTYDNTNNAVVILPPTGGWTRAHQYAIALLAGAKGVQGAKGETVIGSSTWALVSSPNPLVDCPSGDLTSAACTLSVDVIPSTLTDPAARLADQIKSAKQLETIRMGYAPVLAQIEKAQGLTRAEIPVLWTFTIVDAGEVTFDPANSVIPFPNDVVRDPVAKKINLPNPKTGMPFGKNDCAMATDPTVELYCGLNTLDGFSTVVAPISENSNAAGAVAQATIDGTTLVANMTVGLVPANPMAPMGEQTKPNFKPCLNCLSSQPAMPPANPPPQQLQWELLSPLDEQTQYAAWVTGDVKDDQGKGVIANPVFALLRLKNPLLDTNKHATVNVLTDAQAAQLEPLRTAMSPLFTKLEASGVPHTNVALAWAFTTQSEATVLDQLRDYPANALLQLATTPLYVFDATAQYKQIGMLENDPGIANIGKVLVGAFTTAVAITGPAGTLNPYAPKFLPVTFTLALPATPPPAGGYPLTIFGHGILGSHDEMTKIAGVLADPAYGAQATIAMDTVFHGERSSCTGSAASIMMTSDDDACANPMTQMCNKDPLAGRCVARDPMTAMLMTCKPGTADDYNVCAQNGQGACASNGKCEGGDFARDMGALGMSPMASLVPFTPPLISGSSFLSLTNYFGTRDHMRQQVIDLAQLVRLIKGTTAMTSLTAQATAAAGAPVSFDLTKLGFLGVSLGSMMGSLYTAVSPDVTNVVLNVPGGDLTQDILTAQAPYLATQRTALLAALAGQGLVVGTPAFDQFIGIAQWILDASDPANVGWRLTHPATVGKTTAPNPNRKAFIQFIQGDEWVPNVTNLALVAAAQRPVGTTPPSYGCMAPLACYEFTDTIDGFNMTSVPLDHRHGFLLVQPSTDPAAVMLTATAQKQAATFLMAGHL